MTNQLPKWILNPNPNLYLSDNYLVLDFETSNLDKGSALNPDNTIICGVWRYEGREKAIVGSEYRFGELIEDIKKADFLVAHNAKFELQWLFRCGLDLTKIIIYDTQIGEYVLLGNRSASLDLDSVAGRYGFSGKDSLVSTLIKGGVDPREIPTEWLVEYDKIDVQITEGVFLKQREKLRKKGLLPAMYTRCLLTPVLADIERHGVTIDGERVRAVHRKLMEEYNEVIRDLNQLTGGINPKSGPQVADFLYNKLKFKELKNAYGKPNRTAKGRPKTDIQTILKLKPTNERQREFLRLKKRQAYLDAKLSKTVQKFFDCLEDPDEPGIIKARFNQTVTQTHRLSSTGAKYKAQFQNFDREFKPLITARYPGWSVGEGDEAQLEWRTAAFLSQDPVAIKGILEGEDVHSFTAFELFKEQLKEANGGTMPTVEEIKKKYGFWRQEAKPETFKPVYGGEYGSEAQMRYYKAFREKYPTLAGVQVSWCHEVLGSGELKTVTGLIFYWPGTKLDRRGQITNKRSIYNYPIQSLATADIVPVAVVCLWHRMKSLNLESFIVNTVHDSAIAEIAPGEEEIYEELVHQSFVDDVYEYLYNCYGIDFNVPLEAEVKVKLNWDDSKEWQEKWLN